MGLIPKDEKYFDHFDMLAAKIEEGTKLFLHMLNNYDDFEYTVIKMKEIEHEADVITHNTYEKLHRSFITPLDREDIYALLNKMDSVLDMAEATATRMSLYKIKEPTQAIIDLAKILNESAKKIREIVSALRDLKKSQMILDGCVEINTLENQGDFIMRNAIADLFENEKDIFKVIKLKEVYERLEEAIDNAEDVSNIIEGIVLKHG